MARELRAAADASRRRHLIRETEGHPPDLDSYPALCQALRDLIDRRGISQRELARRDETGLLKRATVGAVLRMERAAQREVTIAIVRACGVSDSAVEDWDAAWHCWGLPHRQAMERRQSAHRRLGAHSHRWGGAW